MVNYNEIAKCIALEVLVSEYGIWINDVTADMVVIDNEELFKKAVKKLLNKT